MSPHSLASRVPPTEGGSLASFAASALAQKESKYPSVQTFKAARETGPDDKQVDLNAEKEQGEHITIRSSQAGSSAVPADGEDEKEHTTNHPRDDNGQQSSDPLKNAFYATIGFGAGASVMSIIHNAPGAIALYRQSRQSAADSRRSAGTHGTELQSVAGPQPSQSRGT